ncbi:hypothetical protein [Bradyrhizobium australiense]|uniref:Uncharacterized protein n=1 Tax=Bradyrhizobium australiense TaxID=2721161 RepID=A0A7Y4LWN8_9BRAD|nr:hypothetical protein [Bradyrhizobium australiense]NOJ41401.1 hypothetical protein [Bradyrhizobium australiense]
MLNTAEMCVPAERMPGVPLLANMTAFGKTPFLCDGRIRGNYSTVIWPVSALRVANKGQEDL